MCPRKKKPEPIVYGPIRTPGMPKLKIDDPNTVAYVVISNKKLSIYFIVGDKWERKMSLKAFELQCDPMVFCHLGKQHSINMSYADTFRYLGKGITVVLKNKLELYVAEVHKENFIKLAKLFKIGRYAPKEKIAPRLRRLLRSALLLELLLISDSLMEFFVCFDVLEEIFCLGI